MKNCFKKYFLLLTLFAVVNSLKSERFVSSATVITTQPTLSDSNFCPGEELNLSVQADGINLTYQWQRDGIDLIGERNSILEIATLNASNQGAYKVIVTGEEGVEVSNVVQVNVLSSVEITTEPYSISVCAGREAIFSTSVTGSGPITYQWFKVGSSSGSSDILIPHATSNILSISPATTVDAGEYYVKVTGECGVVVSDEASLNVTLNETAVVSLSVSSDEVCKGDGAVFTATAGGAGSSPTYEFRDANTSDVLQSASASNTYAPSELLATSSVEVLMTSNSTCLAPDQPNPVKDIATITVIEPAVAQIVNPMFDPFTNEYFTGDDFVNNITALDLGPGYSVFWTNPDGIQQGVISSPRSYVTNLISLDLIEPQQGRPFEGQGTTRLMVSVLDNGGICPTATDEITIIRKDISIPSLNLPAEVCVTDFPYVIQGSSFNPEIEVPNVIDVDGATGNGSGFVFTNTNAITIDTPPLISGNSEEFGFTYAIDNSVSGTSTESTGVLTVYAEPSIADAGPDMTTCSDRVTLEAIQPTIGTGAWACSGGIVSDASDPKAILSGILPNQVITCSWVVANGVCLGYSSDVVITRLPIDNISVSLSSIPDICEGESLTIVADWVSSGNPTFEWDYSEDSNGPITTSSSVFILNDLNVGFGSVAVRMATDSKCPNPAFTEDVVTINVVPSPSPKIIPAVSDTTICEGSFVNLIASNLPFGSTTYQWLVNGTPINDQNAPTLQGLSTAGNYSFRIDNGVCLPVSSDQITIKVAEKPSVEVLNTVNGEILSNDINNIALEAIHTGGTFYWSRDDDFMTINDSLALSTTAKIKWNSIVPVNFTSVNGPCIVSERVYIRTNDPLGLDQTVSLNNPRVFNLEGLGSFHDFHLSVFDLNGLELLNESITRGEQLGLSSVGKGVYVYRLSYDSGSKIISGKLHVIE